MTPEGKAKEIIVRRGLDSLLSIASEDALLEDIARAIREAEAAAYQRGVEDGRTEERERCARIAEENARLCGGSRTDGDKTLWADPGSHSDAHDACLEGLSIAEAIRGGSDGR